MLKQRPFARKHSKSRPHSCAVLNYTSMPMTTRYLNLITVCAVVSYILMTGCATEISVRRVNRIDNLANANFNTESGLMEQTVNLLANHLLMHDYERKPEKLLRHVETLFDAEPRSYFLAAMADVSFHVGRRYASNSDLANSYYTASALYSYAFLAAMDNPKEEPYSAIRVQMIQLYNAAVNEIFAFLHQKKLYRKNGFSITTPTDKRITFKPPVYHLPLAPEHYADFKLCADFETRNLTHATRHFGFGAPLICELIEDHASTGSLYAKDQMMPATLIVNFTFNDKKNTHAELVFNDTREISHCTIGKHQVPLAMDFSTPIAYMAKKPLPMNHFLYMLYPERTASMQGLYRFEAFNDKRIPVVLVHGLMSNTRTWMQMLNTLQNDPDIRKYYQFWGFSYSSGNPILFSARQFRDALKAEREKLLKQGKSVEMFDRMVVVGHSMGGLLAKTTIMDTGDAVANEILKQLPENVTFNDLDTQQQSVLKDILFFEHLPFVKRVIFIAVPHRGSDFATNIIGRIGSALITLPSNIVSSINGIVRGVLLLDKKMELPTGIDNLMPDSHALAALNNVAFVPGVPYHSIIGNQDKAGVPSGSDGIVPYLSSHLDGVQSELVVKSDHSAQQNPLCIQEVRRILLQHLEGYDDIILNIPKLPKAGKQ